MKPKFWGGFHDAPLAAGTDRGHVNCHFHARALALRGLLEYAIVAGDSDIGSFVQSSFEYIRSFGLPELGFIPCFTGFQSTAGGVLGMGRYMEGCFIGDQIAMAIKLSEAGFGDFWEHADQTIRNHLMEAQWTDKEMLRRIVSHSPHRPAGSNYDLNHVGEEDHAHRPTGQHPGMEYAGDDVIDRAMGIYFLFNGPVSVDCARGIQCCTANATRGLYYAWESTTRCEGDNATVNLLLNRAAPWLDVESYLPYEGKALIRNKKARRISVRIPAWVSPSKLRCRVNEQDCQPARIGRYVVFDSLKPADVIELTFPVPDRTITRVVDSGTETERPITIRLRGNTAIEVSPTNEAPTAYQFYRREHMKADKAPLRKATRRVSPVIPRW
jgi:hypothetical protein